MDIPQTHCSVVEQPNEQGCNNIRSDFSPEHSWLFDNINNA